MLRKALICSLVLNAAPLAAQADSVLAAPGPHYAASGSWRFFFGSSYRDVWSRPARIPVLDLRRHAGGMRVLREGTGRQTRSLRLMGGDGREYVFRSMDKDVTPRTPGREGGSVRSRLRQDQTRAQLPGAALVASALMRRAGIPHARPRLYLLPDDPALGRYRRTFGGMVGTLELHLDPAVATEVGVPGATTIIDTEELLQRLDDSVGHRVDARAYLRARLLDVWIGDWDRHPGQWRWARVEEIGLVRWVPIPKDRDYAFADYDGLLPALSRLAGPMGVVRFSGRYPRLRPLVASAAEMDRRFLAELPEAEWQVAARQLAGRMTDPVIRQALAELPIEHRRMVALRLERSLRSRRAALPQMARRFYWRLAADAEVVGSGRGDHVRVDRREDGTLLLTVRSAGQETFRRVYLQGETQRLWIRPGRGADTVTVTGGRGCTWLMLDLGDPADVLRGDADGPTHRLPR